MRNVLESQLIAMLQSRNILTNYTAKETKSCMHLRDILNTTALRKRRTLFKAFVVSQFNYYLLLWMFIQKKNKNGQMISVNGN